MFVILSLAYNNDKPYNIRYQINMFMILLNNNSLTNVTIKFNCIDDR